MVGSSHQGWHRYFPAKIGKVIEKREMVHVIKDVQNVLGTFVTITVAHPDVDEGIGALRAAFDEIYRIQDLMSVHKQSSEVGVLNREGFCEGISSDTKYVIQRAKDFSELSGGAFDISVLPVLKLLEESAHKSKVPADTEISERLELVNYTNIIIEDRKISFRKAGMGITLAGVAKGYAVDNAIETLRRGNIRHALVNAGGDIRSLGGKTETMPWKAAIRDPRNKTRIVTVVELYDQAIATSGTYQRSFNDMINPKTGRPAQGVLSSTVIAEKALDADALATCMFILGAEKRIELLGRLNGVRSLVITSDG
ncbi:MAG TPA: FAD:protein FMN transferase, partial [Dehalococcoidia bacterium]|nr:FAD:protein FMN transferase [Dehalococcoidia bacterium]